MAKIINLTPHDVVLIISEERSVTFPSYAAVRPIPRVSSRTVSDGDIDGFPLTRTEYGEVENLPEPKDGVWYIVSAMVAGRCPDRRDLVIPNEAVRDEKGRIIGCRSFGRI